MEFNPALKFSSGKEIVTNNVKLKVAGIEYQIHANKWIKLEFDTNYAQYQVTASFDGYSIRGGSVVYGSSSDEITIQAKDIPKLDDKMYALRNEVQEILSDVNNGISSSEKSLTGLVFQKNEAQQKINRAWDLLKENKKSVDRIQNSYLKNIDRFIEDDNLDRITKEVYYAENSAKKIDDNLKEISKLIEEAKELEKQKFCFLWWCW